MTYPEALRLLGRLRVANRMAIASGFARKASILGQMADDVLGAIADFQGHGCPAITWIRS